jgi:hypothetical protein
MLNLCRIVVAILKMATGRNFSMSEINSGHHYLPISEILMISYNVEFLRYCGGHFQNGDRSNFSMSGINSGHHYLPTYQILMISDNVELCRVLAAILKMAYISKILKTQNCSSNGDLSLCQRSSCPLSCHICPFLTNNVV